MSGERNEPLWLTTEGLSRLLGGISTSTIRGWRLAGIGPAYVKFGGAVRYSRAEVEQWIAAGGDRPADPTPPRSAARRPSAGALPAPSGDAGRQDESTAPRRPR
jgi:predicted DNA-binding transcriptional regulator AlpA